MEWAAAVEVASAVGLAAVVEVPEHNSSGRGTSGGVREGHSGSRGTTLATIGIWWGWGRQQWWVRAVLKLEVRTVSEVRTVVVKWVSTIMANNSS